MNASAPIPSAFRVLTEEERHQSMLASLAEWQSHEDVWVYGYGSLIWRPEFAFLERRAAHLQGYHRALCLWSRINRGTPERPGLVFGLDTGGSCHGVVFRVAAQNVPSTFEALWRREMPSGAYEPLWLPCETEHGMVRALVFVMNRNTDAYVPKMPLEQLVEVVHGAHGINGPCIEYVLETAAALKQSKIEDQRLQVVVDALRQYLPTHHHTPL